MDDLGRTRAFGAIRHGRRWRSWAITLASTLLLVQALGVSSVSATGTTVRILYAPASPIVANTTASFTAQITPYSAGRTISWYANGGLAGRSTTNPNGIASIGLTFGSGGYGIIAVVEPIDNVDRAQSDQFLLVVTPDPSRSPDMFSVERLGTGTIGAKGTTAQIAVDRTGVTDTSLWITATDAASGDSLNVQLRAPAGSTLDPGVYRSDASNLWTPQPGCGSGSITDFDILSMERDAAGVPISFAITFVFLCNEDQYWPMVGAVRYNSTTPMPHLSLPVGNPVFDPVIEGHAGTPRAFAITNDGDVPVSLGTIVMQGADAASYSRTNDTCSGRTFAAGDSCAFDLTFVPSTAGTRSATIAIPSDLGLSPVILPVRGQALIAEAVSQPIASGDNEYFVPGIRYGATVLPTPVGNPSECLVDGNHVDGTTPDAHGQVSCRTPRPAPGSHTLVIRYVGGPFNGEATSPTTTFTIDPTTATTVSSNVTSTTQDVAVNIVATVGFHGDVTYDGGTLSMTDETTGEVVASGPVGPGAPSIAVTRPFAAGAHHLVARYSGTDGEDASTGSIDLSISAAPVDVTRPTSTAPTARPVGAGSSLVGGAVPVRVSFTGADTGSGIDHFVLYQSTDGGAFVAIVDHVLIGAVTRNLRPGHTYRFAVRALDRANNVGLLTVGSSLRLTSVSQSAAAVHYRGTWATSASPIWLGGTARHSATPGSTATYTFTGRAIAWVGLKSATRGKARVYVNGVLKATVDLGSAITLKQRIVWSANYTSSATRTVTIKVLGTSGRARVDIDGFIVGR